MNTTDLAVVAGTMVISFIWIAHNAKMQYNLMQFSPVYGVLAWFGATVLGFYIAFELSMKWGIV